MMMNGLLWFAYRFLNVVSAIPELLIPFVRFYCRYIQDVFRRQFPLKEQVFLLIQLHLRVFSITGLPNTFYLI